MKLNLGLHRQRKELRRVIFTAAASMLALVATGCGLEKNSNAVAELSLLGTGNGQFKGPSATAYSTTVYPYVRANCVACHGDVQVPKFANAVVTSAFEAAVTVTSFDKPEFSTFVAKIKDGHCGSACSTDGTKMISLIKDWKTASIAAGGGGGGGEDIRVGNMITAQISVPAPNPSACPNATALKCTSEGLDAGKPCTNVCWTKLKFPASTMKPIGSAQNTAANPKVVRSWFEIDFAYENYATDAGPASYVLRNPRLISADGPVYIFDTKTWLNGNYRPELGGAFRKIDTVVDKAIFDSATCSIPAAPNPIDPNHIGASCKPAAQPLFSTAASSAGIIQEKTSLANPDKLSFSFEYYQEGIAGDCGDLNLFMTNVYTPIQIQAVACLDCHKAGGAVSEAGQRFNMDMTDTANGADLLTRQKTVCNKFLRRTNFTYIDNSPIIVQPTQGLNGMPAQPNFDAYRADWKAWIQREADLHH